MSQIVYRRPLTLTVNGWFFLLSGMFSLLCALAVQGGTLALDSELILSPWPTRMTGDRELWMWALFAPLNIWMGRLLLLGKAQARRFMVVLGSLHFTSSLYLYVLVSPALWVGVLHILIYTSLRQPQVERFCDPSTEYRRRNKFTEEVRMRDRRSWAFLLWVLFTAGLCLAPVFVLSVKYDPALSSELTSGQMALSLCFTAGVVALGLAALGAVCYFADHPVYRRRDLGLSLFLGTLGYAFIFGLEFTARCEALQRGIALLDEPSLGFEVSGDMILLSALVVLGLGIVGVRFCRRGVEQVEEFHRDFDLRVRG